MVKMLLCVGCRFVLFVNVSFRMATIKILAYY